MGSDRQFARFTGRHTAAGAGRGRCGATAGLRVGRPRHPPHSPTAVTPLTALLAPRLAPLTQSHCTVSQICGGRCRAHSAPRTAVLATWRCAAGTGWERQHPPGEPDNPLLCCAGQRNRNSEPRPRPPCQHAAQWGERSSFYFTAVPGFLLYSLARAVVVCSCWRSGDRNYSSRSADWSPVTTCPSRTVRHNTLHSFQN